VFLQQLDDLFFRKSALTHVRLPVGTDSTQKRGRLSRRARLALSRWALPKGGNPNRRASEVLPKQEKIRTPTPASVEVIEIFVDFGAGEGIRTLDPNLGKVAPGSVIQRDRLCKR
jgi:hypothetical protein